MLHVKCNCRFEQRGGDGRLMGLLIRGMLHLGERPTSPRIWIVTLGVCECVCV